MKLNGITWTALVLTVVGGLNWGLVGAFQYNLVESILGGMEGLERTIYVVVGLSALYLFIAAVSKKS